MIKPYDDQFSVDYTQESLKNIFLCQPETSASQGCYADEIFQVGIQDDWLKRLESRPLPSSLLLASGVLLDPVAIDLLKKWADCGVQIFLLLADKSQNINAIEALSGRCCIRTGVSQSGMLIVSDPAVDQSSRWGVLYSSGFTGKNHYGYSIALEDRQVDDYYRLFCHLFWKEAKYEFLEQGKQKPCADAPVKYITLGHEHVFAKKLPSHLVRSLDIHGTLLTNTPSGSEKLWQLIETNNLELSACKLMLSIDQVTGKTLQGFVEQSERVELVEAPHLPQVFVSDGDCWLLPQICDSGSVVWGVKGTDEQAASLDNYQSELSGSRKWRFIREIQVGELESPLRFLDHIDESVECSDAEFVSLGTLECQSFQDFEQQSPATLAEQCGLTRFQESKLARNITYSITIAPPYLPRKAMKDNLHLRWDNIQQSWSSRVEELESRHKRLQSEQEKLTDTIGKIMANFLTGRINTARKTEKKLSDLKGVELASLSPSVREEQLQEINKLSSLLMSDSEKFAQEKDKAEQMRVWQEQKANLDKKLESITRLKMSAEEAWKLFNEGQAGRRSTAEREIEGAWQALLSTRESSDADVTALSSAKNIDEWISNNISHLNDFFGECENHESDQKLTKAWQSFLQSFGNNDSLKKQLKELEAYSAGDIRQWLQSPTLSLSKKMHKEIDKIKSSSAFSQTSKEVEEVKRQLRMMQQTYRQGIKSIEREGQDCEKKCAESDAALKRIMDDVDRHEQAKTNIKPRDTKGILGRLFGSGHSTVSQDFVLKFPDEDLPQVGNLYSGNGERFLAIMRRDDVEQGKRDAERLKARLVVERES